MAWSCVPGYCPEIHLVSGVVVEQRVNAVVWKCREQLRRRESARRVGRGWRNVLATGVRPCPNLDVKAAAVIQCGAL